jgi:predicted secreted hydrolase
VIDLRRTFILGLLTLVMPCWVPNATAEETIGAVVTPLKSFSFPRDHGAHPEFRTEWWYVTGHVTTDSGKPLGFQVTFFRSRTGIGENSPSRFAPSQILFAHAAIADPALGKLRHDDRIARQGFGARASTESLDVAIDDWTMKATGSLIIAKVRGKDFAIDLTLTQTVPPLLQGENGFSRKGPKPNQASYYVSLPQMKVDGALEIAGKREQVRGTAWFDQEWSSSYLSDEAKGWDWLGANLDDGGALMAFQMRAKSGGVLWASGTRLAADGNITRLGKDDVAFTPLREWQSPRTGARWPVAMRVRAGEETFELKPWMDDQELDSARSTGIIYWEGAVDVLKAEKKLGRGYLELTGYAKPLKF